MDVSIESYLVRIYRRNPREPGAVAGLVEIIERERSETFKSAEELMQILGIDDGSAGERSEKEER